MKAASGLTVSGLTVEAVSTGTPIVRDASFVVGAAESVALTGSSGSGKSSLAHALLGVLPTGLRCDRGRIQFNGDPVFQDGEGFFEMVRGSRIGLVQQDARGAFNPLFTIGKQISLVYRHHLGGTPDDARRDIIDLLEKLAFAEPEQVYDSYAGELSGGMAQRCQIALALCPRPELIIADEPFSALDPTVQMHLVDLFGSIQEQTGFSLLFITHDLDLAEFLCSRQLVMSEGCLHEASVKRPHAVCI